MGSPLTGALALLSRKAFRNLCQAGYKQKVREAMTPEAFDRRYEESEMHDGHVDLESNSLTYPDALALSAAVRQCAALEELCLYNNAVCAAVRNAMASALTAAREPATRVPWSMPWRGGTCFMPQRCRQADSRLVCTHTGRCPDDEDDMERSEGGAPQKRVKLE